MIKSNRIPRKFYKLYITMLIETSAAAPGDRATIYRDEYNELIMETENGRKYRVFISMLRNPEVVRIDRIAENDPATEEQKNKERAFLSDYIIEARDSAKVERLLKDTSNRAELFWEDVRRIAGSLSDHAQSRYQVLAEALYKRRFTAPTTPAADEAEQIPTESHSAPQSATETATAPAEEITSKRKYIFRIYTDWTVYAGRLSEEVITAGSDEEAQQIAIERAAGRAFTCNRAYTAEEAPKDPRRDAETRAAITDEETPAEAAETPQRATEDAQSALYIVQCRSPRRSWIDYSSPAPLEKCEEIKATAEARRTCNIYGELIIYRITEAPQEATASAAEAAESPAEPHGETQTGNTPQATAEARRTPAETRGGRETTNTPPTDAESPTEARSAPTATAGSTAANAPGLQANKASPNAA